MITETDIYEIEINEYRIVDGVVSFIDFGYGFIVKKHSYTMYIGYTVEMGSGRVL